MVHGSMEIVHEGLLRKSPPPKRLWRAKWRTRWFVLRSGELPGQYFLEYYTDRTCRKIKGKIDLDQCEQVDAGITFANRKFEYKYMFDIKTPKRVYYLCAETEQEMNRWVDCVCQVCGLKVYTHEDEYFDQLSMLDHLSGTAGQTSSTSALSDPPSPNISPTSPASTISGPYIPISECITGKKFTSNFSSNFSFGEDETSPSTLDCHRSSIPNEMAPPAPNLETVTTTLQCSGGLSYNSSAIVLLRLSGTTPEDTASIQSPHGTESSSVFTDDDWALTPNKSETQFFSEAVTATGGQITWESYVKEDKWEDASSSNQVPGILVEKGMLEDTDEVNYNEDSLVPPRPPKPAHLSESVHQCYQNSDTIVKASYVKSISPQEKDKNILAIRKISVENEIYASDSEPSPTSISGMKPQVIPADTKDAMNSFYSYPSDDTFVNTESEYCKKPVIGNLASPIFHGQVFLYDIRNDDVQEKHIEIDSKSSPIGIYCNIVANPYQPPAVNRGLKPKKPGENDSIDFSPSPSGASLELGAVGGLAITPNYSAPIVDRNLKPLKKTSAELQSSCLYTNNFKLEPAPTRQKLIEQRKTSCKLGQATLMSINGHESDDGADQISDLGSRRNSTTVDEQNIHRLQHEIQYLDLDLESEVPQSPKSAKVLTAKAGSTVGAGAPSVVYKTVDFIKTDAFNKMRHIVEDTYRKNQ